MNSSKGSRLTAYELVFEKIPSTLLCDDMVAAAIREHKIDCIVVGADRIAANGDTANKIGTFQLAILAKHFKIPFYVAAPMTTVDFDCENGKAITVEQSQVSVYLKEDFQQPIFSKTSQKWPFSRSPGFARLFRTQANFVPCLACD